MRATAHAYALIDSYVYGFAVQEASLPIEGPDERRRGGRAIMEPCRRRVPAPDGDRTEHVIQPGYDFGAEFAFGLDLVLDGVARLLEGCHRLAEVARVRGAARRGIRCSTCTSCVLLANAVAWWLYRFTPLPEPPHSRRRDER